MTDVKVVPGAARGRAGLFLAAALAITVWSGVVFRAMHEPEPIVPGPGVTAQKMLGDYVPAVAKSPADTPVYLLEGPEPGGTLLLLGGTHPQEISGVLAAVLTIENARVRRGRVLVIPQANRSGFTYTEPHEGFPHSFEIPTPHGIRWFRLGMRLTNPIHQWPDPELYVHHPSGERMVGIESRNLNRNFPGRPDGSYTARLAHAITVLAVVERAALVFDMHEAYPEYPIINMLVAHERAFEIATLAVINLKARNIPIDVMPSPKHLHGLSHREFGDHTTAYALLAETANPGMGRFRGRTDERLIVGGRDENYLRAARLKRLFVPFTEKGHPLEGRVARHLAAVEETLGAYNEAHPDAPIVIEGLPAYDEVVRQGLGPFLRPPPPRAAARKEGMAAELIGNMS